MSTPPQQPADGFGAPQEPPAGGFGAPVPPPPGHQPGAQPEAQPGYGYPQQQPGQPAQPNPYGQPTAPYGQPQQNPYGQPQPNPYGQPTPPYGQPQPNPYGQQPVTQPMHTAGAPTPGRPPKAPGDGAKARVAIVVAAVVAVAAIVGGGLWLVQDKDGGPEGSGSDAKNSASPKPGGLEDVPVGPALERAPADPAAKGVMEVVVPKVTNLVNVEGSWLTDTVYAKSDVLKIVGYDAATGSPKWTLPLPGQVCGASRETSKDGKAAFLYAATRPTGTLRISPCTEVGVFDMNTGKMDWTTSLKTEAGGDAKLDFKKITISGGTVAAGGLNGGAAWSLADGKNLWAPKVTADGCNDRGYAGGPGLATVRKCGPHGAQYLEVQELDPKTGAPLSTYRMSPGIEWASIVSSRPLVVAADVGDTASDGSGISDLFSIDEKTGKLLQRIPLPSDHYAAKCEATQVESCQHIVVANGKVYVPTEEHEVKSGSFDETNEIVSFDIKTGKQTADRFDAGEDYTMFPLRTDGPNVIAYKRPPYQKGGQVVSIDTQTLKQTVLMEMPGDADITDPETSFSAQFAEYRYAKGRLFISETMIDKPYTTSKEKDYLIVSYTTG
ncbi:PQQ-binding-like beta-propeller repeat protein [Streptomyces sp. NRRL S-87]|uniref:outer membrane protein assembly factor BamB family protein n=1 Tax=Streptomyces sp. NRRL S-87 TaxID=1463920 RepID=UPI0004BF5763|nr:PQQ-binding-like beta-propeller repeat protein [Streptomyces sp. NRRL S-87]